MIPRTIFIALIIAASAVPAYSQQKYSAEEIVLNVQKKYSAIRDASADFVQTTTLRFGKNAVEQSGTVKIKKGNKYKIALPGQLIVTNGTTVWIYSSENNQVLVDSAKENNSVFSPDKFLQGFPSSYTVASFTEQDGILEVLLSPSKKNDRRNPFLSLAMRVEVKTWLIQKIDYTDRNQTKNSITLSHIVLNKGIPDSEFTFIPDRSMNVVDARTLK